VVIRTGGLPGGLAKARLCGIPTVVIESKPFGGGSRGVEAVLQRRWTGTRRT